MSTALFSAHIFPSGYNNAPGCHFRWATPADFKLLHAACYPEKSWAQFRQHFYDLLDWQEHGRCYWLVAEDNAGQIVASGQLILYPHGAELANLAVILARRGEGIGSAVIEALMAVARRLNLDSLEIGVTADNDHALALYQRLGFIEDRRLETAHDEPAIILHKTL